MSATAIIIRFFLFFNVLIYLYTVNNISSYLRHKHTYNNLKSTVILHLFICFHVEHKFIPLSATNSPFAFNKRYFITLLF